MNGFIPKDWDTRIANIPMKSIQWGKERERVLEREKGREMGVAIFVDNLGIGQGNVLATLREEVREVRDLARAGRVQANLGLVKVVRDRVELAGAKASCVW